MANPVKKLMGQTAIYGLPNILSRLLNYLLTPFVTRAFLPEEYGITTEMYAYAGFFMILLTYGMETGYFRFARKNENPDMVFTTTAVPLLFTSIFFIFVMFLFSQKIAGILQYSKHPEFIVWFSIIIAVDAFVSIPFAKLRQEGKAKKFALFKFINIFSNIFLTLWFLVLCKNNSNPFLHQFYISKLNFLYNERIGVGYVFIANLAASVITLGLFLPEFFKIKYRIDKQLLKQILKYSFPLLFVGLAGMVNEVADRIFLKYFTVAPSDVSNKHAYIMSQIGIYGANYKLSILMSLFIQSFRYAAEPFFFAHQTENGERKVYADVMKYFVIFCLTIFLGIMMYIDIAKYFIAEEYRMGLVVVPILLLANLFLGIIYNLSIWYKLTDKTSLGAYLTIFGAVVTIVLNGLLIPRIGYLGAAWATFACYFLMAVASYILGQKYYHVEYQLKRIFLYFAVALGIYFGRSFISITDFYLSIGLNTILFFGFISWITYTEKIHIILKRMIFRK
jgi:O-antigen/teichoic acid export membrane protein